MKKIIKKKKDKKEEEDVCEGGRGSLGSIDDEIDAIV